MAIADLENAKDVVSSNDVFSIFCRHACTNGGLSNINKEVVRQRYHFLISQDMCSDNVLSLSTGNDEEIFARTLQKMHQQPHSQVIPCH